MNVFLYIGVILILAICGWIQLNRLTRLSTFAVWTAFLVVLSSSLFSGPSSFLGFKVDALSRVMFLMILFISGIVHLFSFRYMSGDLRINTYFSQLTLLTASSLGFALSNQMFLSCGFWVLNQILLSCLMIHKSGWNQARHAGLLFLKWGLIGSLSLILGMSLLSWNAGSLVLAILFILLAALIQSGVWPFHVWLMSSLNSPTPVSALMHAGLVNAGGLLLAKFAPLILSHSLFLHLIFTFGCISLVLGTIWKLMQSNIKRMLACSTMAQMGFMLVQCGLGLFPAAIAHICCHGLFKGFLFLNSGSAVHTKPVTPISYSPGILMYSTVGALLGALSFAFAGGLSLISLNTQIVLVFFAAIACFYVTASFGRFGVLASVIFGALYGGGIRLIESILEPMDFWKPQPLTGWHISMMVVVFLFVIVINHFSSRWENSRLWKKFYVGMLNASQSDPKTITSIRNEYQF